MRTESGARHAAASSATAAIAWASLRDRRRGAGRWRCASMEKRCAVQSRQGWRRDILLQPARGDRWTRAHASQISNRHASRDSRYVGANASSWFARSPRLADHVEQKGIAGATATENTIADRRLAVDTRPRVVAVLTKGPQRGDWSLGLGTLCHAFRKFFVRGMSHFGAQS